MNSSLIATKKTVKFLALLVLGLILGFVILQATKEEFSCNTSSHVVVKGDTLWGIAEDNCSGNIQKVSDDLVKVYGLPLTIGKTIYLPESDECKLFIKEDQGQEYVYEEC